MVPAGVSRGVRCGPSSNIRVSFSCRRGEQWLACGIVDGISLSRPHVGACMSPRTIALHIGAVILVLCAVPFGASERAALSWWHARTPLKTVWTAEDNAEPFRVTPMVFTPHASFGLDKRFELTADGRIRIDGRPWLRLVGRQVQANNGEVQATVGDDGHLRGDYVRLAFSGSDLVMNDGTTVTIDARGVVKAPPFRVIGRIDGVVDTPAKRRAALLVASLVIALPPPPPTMSD